MADMPLTVFDPLKTYVHLEEGGGARLVEVAEDFWSKIGERTDLQAGRLVTAFRMTDDWSVWEMHPAGEELVVLLSGAIDLFLQTDGGEPIVEMRERAAFLIPRGTWHTAHVHAPSEMLFITHGAGTEHRPVEQGRQAV
jgi:mannose-6-phosphate isomerase-like protein (cupin superfamily)